MGRMLAALALVAVVILESAGAAHATTITFDLNCVLGHPTGSSVDCDVPSYGTITLDDSIGDGDIRLTVDLAGTGEKFKDLFFNYAGSATGITAGPGTTNLFDLDNRGTNPYDGLFDIGDLDATADPFSIVFYGWNSTSANITNSSTSGANNVALLLTDFQVLDSLGLTYLSLHIQSIGPDGCKADTPAQYCTPGSTGGGSMNSVGSNSFDPPGGGGGGETPVPEPGSLLLLATGLLGGARGLQRRRRS